MRHFCSFLCLLCLTLAGCSNVKEVQYKPALSQPEDAHPAPIGWSGLKARLPTGAEIGTLALHDGPLPGCGLPMVDADRSLFTDAIDKTDLSDTFDEALEAQGYDIVGNLDFEFPEDFEDEEARSEYKVGGTVRSIDVFACHTEPYINPFKIDLNGFTGELYMEIEWSLYDALRRTVVYKTRTEGFAKRTRANQDGLTLLINEAFEMAAHNLGADTAFHDLIFFGTKPPDGWKEQKKFAERPRQYDPLEKIELGNLLLSTDPFPNHAEKSRKAAVMIQTGSSHGSGFFITRQGHLLTNAHVTGDAQRVRVVTADGAKALTAEVLRKHKLWDVALLKLEEIPADFEIMALPVRAAWPKVSEDVYVIGAPLSKTYQDTVMKGIVSAHRKNYKFMGARLDLIQADVTTHGGNSGGPLLDAYGNILGLVHGGTSVGSGADASLNLFIPISEALKALDIEYTNTIPAKTASAEEENAPVKLTP
jgi:serine protease Do